MKKLMFVTALVASAVAFADPINAISFEGYSADATVGNTADTPDTSGGDNGMYFYFDSTDDGSSVKAFGSGDVAAPQITRPRYFASASPNANYLELSTEGGILWRSINTLNSDTSGETPVYSLGNAEPVAAAGTFFDSLVQFTPTEDGNPPELEPADKLAIWLNVDTSGATPVTNLMVRAGWVDAMGTPVASNFVLTGTSVVAGEWYRLTVKVVPNIIDTEGMYGSFYNIPAFIIYVDGTEMAATTAPIDASLANLDDTIASGFASLVAANKVFPSIVPPEQGVPYGLQGVGFKGSGALDDLVWTEDDPFDVPAALTFTLTWDPTMVSAVSYVLSTDASTTNALTSGTAVSIAAGTQGTVELIPTFEAGYEFDHLQIGESSWEYLTFPVPDVSTNGTLVAKASAPAYPTYLSTADAAIKAKYDTWKATYGADVNSAYETAFLLNMDPEASVAAGTALLKIASITQVSGGWELEITSDATTLTAESNNSGIVGNGYLAITYAADLATLASGGTTVNLPVTVTSGAIKVTVTASGAKFMKAKLSATAEPLN